MISNEVTASTLIVCLVSLWSVNEKCVAIWRLLD